MKKLIIVMVLMVGCSDQSQRDNRIDIVCRPISGDRCLCCNNTADSNIRCSVSTTSSFFTESCKVMKDGGYMVIIGDRK